MDVWAGVTSPDARTEAAARLRQPELTPVLREVDLKTRALWAGVSLEDYPDTTLLDIDLLYRAKELDVYAHARTMIDLKLADMSARQLGKDDAKDDEAAESDIADWERRGEEIKREIREKLSFAFAPEHIRAMMTLRDAPPPVPQLAGTVPSVARTILQLLEANAFTHGPWQDSELRRQLAKDDARTRLEATAMAGLEP